MNSQATKRILSILLAALLAFTGGPAFAADAGEAAPAVGVSEAAILPDLSNLEAPTPAPPRSGARQPLELVPRDAAAAERTRQSSPGMTRGTNTQDNSTINMSGNLATSIYIVKDDIRKQVVAAAFGVYSVGEPLLPVIDQTGYADAVAALNANSTLASVLNQAVAYMELDSSSAIGNISWVGPWTAKQVKVILTELDTDGNDGILLGYFDPNDFPRGSSQNSDYYLYIDVGPVVGGGFERYRNQRDQFIGTILHEYAHLVNFSKGYAVNSGMTNAQMQTWLDEAIATTVAYNYSNTFEQPYLDAFLGQGFADATGYVPNDTAWNNAGDQIDANYGAAALMMLDLTQYELGVAPMESIIHYRRTDNSYVNSLNAVAAAYGGNFNEFFTTFNLDVAVDNDFDDHSAALTALGSEFYGLDAIEDIWQERYQSDESYAGVTPLTANTDVDVSAKFEDRTYYSHLYLADAVGSDSSQVQINVPSDPNTRYFVITPYDQTDVDTDTEWQDCAKQTAQLADGANTVTVGTNNQFAVLAVQYSSAMGSGQTLRFSPLTSAKDITAFALNGENGVINRTDITVRLPYGTNVTGLTPNITHTGASISPTGPQNFTNPVQYVVTATDGTTKTYTVTVQVASAPPSGTMPSVSTDRLTVANGETATFTVNLGNGSDGADSATITSSDSGIATVSPDRITASDTVSVTGASIGNTTISIGYSGGGRHGETDTIAVTVTETGGNPPDPDPDPDPGSGYNPINPPSEPISPYNDAMFAFNGEYANLVEIRLNNHLLAMMPNGERQNLSGYPGYALVLGHAEAGSVKVTLYKEFLQTLPNGVYSLTVGFKDGGEGTLDFEVERPVIPNPTPGGGRDSSDSGGSSTADTVKPAVPFVLVVDAPKAKAALAEREKSGAGKARIRHNGQIKVLAEAWLVFGNIPVDFDTVDGDGVQVRVTVREPGKMTGDKLLSGYVKGSIVDSRKALFEKWFKNKVRVIHFDQQGDFGQSVRIAAKVDLTGMDTTNLYFYAYDKKTNTYRRIENPAYWIDKNGYLHFTTELSGDIIISEGSLERKQL